MNIIYENNIFYIEKELSSIPWVKIFPKTECKEFSDCDDTTKKILFDTMLKIEKVMLDFYRPDKINIAIFGNYLPKLHIHIMARFKNDTHFPEPMWGKKQRENELVLPDFDKFKEKLAEALQ
jgi:diadenosine tetraphosphate (Ap4A) HIT family hydrolase